MLSGLACAVDALVLISPDRAGPVLDEQIYVHGEWILWPPQTAPGATNQILSLFTGQDWEGPLDALDFGMRDGTYLAAAYGRLRARGFFSARAAIVDRPTFALTRPGLAPPNALILALGAKAPAVPTLSEWADWPEGALICAEAANWDEVAAITAKADGRVLVAEYPPAPGKRWTRYWLRGRGWGPGLPMTRAWKVPGLIPASEVGRLLLRPEEFSWTSDKSAERGGANRWLAFVQSAGPRTLALLMFLAAFFAGCCVYLISIEEPARFASTVVKYFLLWPAAILISGQLTYALGRSGFVLWLPGSFFALTLLAQLLGSALRRLTPESHPLMALFAVGLAATSLGPPLWSLYSNVLGNNVLALSPEGSGAFAGYLSGVCALTSNRWIGRGVAAAALLWGAFLHPWWSAHVWPFALIPVVAWIASEGWFRWWLLPAFALAPLADGRLIGSGVVWAPGNLFERSGDSAAVNLARHVEFLSSPGFLATAMLCGAVAIFVERYFFHRVRRILRVDPRTKALFHAAATLGAMGLFQPLLLYAALMCFVGGLFVLLVDAARTL